MTALWLIPCIELGLLTGMAYAWHDQTRYFRSFGPHDEPVSYTNIEQSPERPR